MRWSCILALTITVSLTSATLCAEDVPQASQPPTPSGREAGEEPKPQSAPPQQRTPEQQRGTEGSPLVVKISPSPEVNSEPNEQREARIEKASQDRWTLIFVGITAISTGLLFFATSGLWVATWRMWKATVKAVADGERSAKAAGDAAKAASDHVGEAAKTAAAMKDAADAALAQSQAAWQQVELMEAQKQIFRQSFIFTHRPRLKVRNIAPRFPRGTHWLVGGAFIDGQLYVANVGDSDATITEHLILVYPTGEELPPARPYEGKNGLHAQQRLAAGVSAPLTFSLENPLTPDEADAIRGSARRSGKLYVMGWIEYKDEVDTRRRTAFCRVYNPATGRFQVVNDPDYEHEE